MKITAEFSSNEELVSFISTFGAIPTEVKVEKVEKVAKIEKVAQEMKAPEETKIASVIKTADAEIVKPDEKKDEDSKITKEMVRAVFTKLFKEGK